MEHIGIRTSATAVAMAAALMLAACGSVSSPAATTGDTPSPTPSATATSTPTEEATATASPTPTATASPQRVLGDAQECENEELGYRVEYPEDWWANEDIAGGSPGVADIEECTYFAREEVAIEPATQIPAEVAIWFSSQRSDTPESQGEVISREETTVDAHDAVVVEYEPPVGGFSPEGTVIYQYLIDTDEGRLAVITDAFGHPDYEQNKEILDAMVETLELDD